MKIKIQKDTAIVILSYNSKQWLSLFLPKIVSESHSGYEVVVVDHFSNDGTSAFIKENFPKIHLLRFEENHGFAWGYDTALKQIDAKYYVLLSADFELTEGWFPPLWQAINADTTIGALQPKIKYYRDKNKFEYAGAAGGFMDSWGYMFCRGRIFDVLEDDKHQYDTSMNLFWASGGCLMVRSDLYHKAGGLDHDFFAHMEEIDLCWRLQLMGYRIAYVPQSTVFHVGGSVITYGSPKKTFYNFRNSFSLFVKNEQFSKLIWLIPLRLILDGVAGIQFFIKGNFKNVLAIIKAHFSFYANIPFLLKKRKMVQKLKANNQIHGVYKGKILVDYFFKGKKNFSDLDINKFS